MKGLSSIEIQEEDFEPDGPTPRTEAFEAAYQRTPRLTVLGRGSFGVTYAVRSTADPSFRYAAKEISIEMLSERKKQEALAEAELLRTLEHRNVVACIDAFLTGSSLYIIMECANGDLSRRIRAQRDRNIFFAEETVMMVFAQICAALAYIHKRKIMHRDLKPANVFVFGHGDLQTCVMKLGDFGLGKTFEATTFAAQTTVGSPSYFSPEICRSKPYGRKSDVWSLGVVLYELASLRVPFSAKVVPAVARMICLSEPESLPEQCSEELVALVRWLLQKDPANRPTAAAALEDPFVQRFHCQGLALATSTAAGVEGEGGIERTSAGLAVPGPARCDSPDPGHMDASCQQDVSGIFKDHDALGLGTISVNQLAQVFQHVAPQLTSTAVAQLLARAGGKRGDAVDVDQFLDWLYK